MRLLLDTHALLWWLAGDERIGDPARDLIGNQDNDVLVSIVSLWEITVKTRIGKLEIDLSEVLENIARNDFEILGVTPAHLLSLTALPMHHRDPFDHLLIAQAIAEKATFVSDDHKTVKYDVRRIGCRAAA